MLAKRKQSQLRLRIFAGPNGSGKSTIIQAVRSFRQKGRPIDFGYYINADDIAMTLRNDRFDFGKFDIEATKKDVLDFAVGSGLLEGDFTLKDLTSSISVRTNLLSVKSPMYIEHIAQVIARYLRGALFDTRKRFSFETVFSHPSTLEIMEQAVLAGYKVYLYFVSTESPEINKYRVKFRVSQNGHDVPPEKIERRYYRSLKLMKRAAQYAHQAFFFDNSKDGSADGTPFTLVAHFKKFGDKKKWDKVPAKNVAQWFKQYYGSKD